MPPPGLLEIITALLFAAMAYRFGWSLDLLAYSALAAACVPLATLDWTVRKLPNVALATTSMTMLAIFGLEVSLDAEADKLLRAIACMLTAVAAHGVLYALDGVAGGDVKLAGVLGLPLGWLSWQAACVGLAVGWLLGGLFVAFVKVFRRHRVTDDVALGSFLTSGALIVILTGP